MTRDDLFSSSMANYRYVPPKHIRTLARPYVLPASTNQKTSATCFLQCAHHERTANFAALKTNLTALTQKIGLHPCIATTLWLGLRTARNSSHYPDVIRDLPHPLQGAIQKQSRLGWDQLFYGRITTAWATAIDEMHPELKLTGMQVMTQIIRTIWDSMLGQWKLRNNHLHQNAARLDLPNYQQAIATLYEQRHQLPPAAQEALYRQPLEVILEQPAPRLQTWAIRGHQYFTRQLKAAKTQARLHTQDIRSFFQRINQTTADLQPP